MSRKTVGSYTYDVMQQEHHLEDLAKQVEKMKSDQFKALIENVEISKKVNNGKDFFVNIIQRVEPLLQNVSHPIFKSTLECPTPDYDQNIFHYKAKDDVVEYLWTVPDRVTCNRLLADPLKAIQEGADPELVKYVFEFRDGDLMKKCHQLNGTTPESPSVILFKKE